MIPARETDLSMHHSSREAPTILVQAGPRTFPAFRPDGQGCGG